MFLGLFVGFMGLICGIVTIVRKLIDPAISAGYSSMMADFNTIWYFVCHVGNIWRVYRADIYSA